MPSRKHLSFALLASVSLAAAVSLAPAPVQACGGTFCDGVAGPTVMPVDQTGETILFWIDDSGSSPHTEAHIQIQYEGDPERFAWIVPVQVPDNEVPEILVGSQALFDNLLSATVPTFTTNTSTIGDCSGASGGVIGFGCSDDTAVSDFGSFSTFADDGGGEGDWGDEPEGPEILDRGFAGAFEYVTLTGDTVEEVVDWLEENGYAQDDDAPPILDEYLQEGFVFVAIKLQSGTGVDEIHPLAIRYPGTEPCIPIRLTRIAAIDDMAIRALFLGDSRVAPQNWPQVEINHSRYDWVNGPANGYDGVVGLAIDEAGGRAWVTEFAGTDSVVSPTGLRDDRWDASAFEDIVPVEVVGELQSQGLLDCSGTSCNFFHPQVEALLNTYLPVPEQLSANQFWGCLECYADLIDPVAWSAPPGFAMDFAERIEQPGDHAVALLEDASTLTRLFTLISPHEMTEDPLFHEVSGLPAVDNNIVATRFNHCAGGPSYFELADGRRVAIDAGGAMPELDDNPAALRIERVPPTGPPQVELDNAAKIDELLEAYNHSRLTGPEPGCALARIGFESLFGMFAMFGIAWFSRGSRRRKHVEN